MSHFFGSSISPGTNNILYHFAYINPRDLALVNRFSLKFLITTEHNWNVKKGLRNDKSYYLYGVLLTYIRFRCNGRLKSIHRPQKCFFFRKTKKFFSHTYLYVYIHVRLCKPMKMKWKLNIHETFSECIAALEITFLQAQYMIYVPWMLGRVPQGISIWTTLF